MIKNVLEVILKSLIDSFKEHPSLTMFMLLLSSGVFGYSISVFAEKDELHTYMEMTDNRFRSIDGQIRELGYGITSRGLESEIFALEMAVERGNAVTSEKLRLKKLRSQLKEVERVNALANSK